MSNDNKPFKFKSFMVLQTVFLGLPLPLVITYWTILYLVYLYYYYFHGFPLYMPKSKTTNIFIIGASATTTLPLKISSLIPSFLFQPFIQLTLSSLQHCAYFHVGTLSLNIYLIQHCMSHCSVDFSLSLNITFALQIILEVIIYFTHLA